jgi:uncharacterized protein (DUF433 family)
MATNLALAHDPIPLAEDAYGTLRLAGTRVTLDSVVALYSRGETVEGLAEAFPSVPLPDLLAVLAYYLRHRAEVEAYLARQRVKEQRARAKVSDITTDPGIPERLRARLNP